MLSDEDLIRYSRQVIIPDIDEEGQEILIAQSILIVGAGGLGCPVALYLAAAGCGKIEIWDNDTVELSNLNRQIGHSSNELGMSKSKSLEKRCREVNKTIQIKSRKIKLDQNSIINKFNVIFDCTDNLNTRYTINKLTHKQKKMLISGSATQFEGQVLVIKSGINNQLPCYECVFPNNLKNSTPEYNCRDAGILGSITSLIASIQVTEGIREILRLNKNMVNLKKNFYLSQTNSNNLILYDASLQEINKIKIKKNLKCKICN